MISLALQCCPVDVNAAMELVQLICDIEPFKHPEGEFFLIYRRDTDPRVVKFFETVAGAKFKAQAHCARNFATGWPEGSNALAGSSFLEMNVLRRSGAFANPAFLLFEPDCVPFRENWIQLLSDEWERKHAAGAECMGHWHQQADPSTLHMNGNAVFSAEFHERHPELAYGCGAQGWDYWFREHFIRLGADTNLIYQWYNSHNLSEEVLAGVTKNGERPALFHGTKDDSARRAMRKLLAEQKAVS